MRNRPGPVKVFIIMGGLFTTLRGQVQPLACLLLLASTVLEAAVCAPADIMLSSQAGVDAFQAQHGPCDEVAGHLYVEAADLVDLRGLAGIRRIGGNFFVSETFHLRNLHGIESLTEVGGNLFMFHNFGLLAPDGLNGLQRVGGHFGLYANIGMTNMDALTSLRSVGGMLAISDAPALLDVDGLRSVETVGNHLVVLLNHSLVDISGLASIRHVGGELIVHLNDVLTNLNGLGSLEHVGIGVRIWENPVLENIDALRRVAHVGQDVFVRDNPQLWDCSGLYRALDTTDHGVSGPGLQPVPDVARDVDIGGNAAGCNSLEEVLTLPIPQGPALAVPVMGLWWNLLLALLVLAAGLAWLRHRSRGSGKSDPSRVSLRDGMVACIPARNGPFAKREA